MQTNQAKNVVISVFDGKSSFDSALEGLRGQGFRNSDVSALYSDGPAEHHGFAGEPLGWLNEAKELRVIGRRNNIVAAGPLLQALAERNAEDSLAPAIEALGLPRYDADFYVSCVKAGKSLVAVHVDEADSAAKARSTMVRAGGQSVFVTENLPIELPNAGDRPLFSDDLRKSG